MKLMRINRCTQFDRYQSQKPVALREGFIINEQGVLHRLNRSIDERERGGWTERKRERRLPNCLFPLLMEYAEGPSYRELHIYISGVYACMHFLQGEPFFEGGNLQVT